MAATAPYGVSGATANEYDLSAALADITMQQRDGVALRQYAPLAEELARRCDHKLYLAIAHRAWGVIHRLAGRSAYAEAEARLKQALQLFEELETRWQIGRTLRELGELAQVQGNIVGARDYFSRALAAFEVMQAAPDAARTQAALEELA